MRAVTARRYAFVAGRWDATLTIIDVDAALAGKPAIVSRVPTSSADPPACALPVSMEFDRVRGRIFVANHGGRASPETVAGMPHGHAGTIAVLDLAKALDPMSAQTALIAELDAGGHGPVACALTPDGTSLLVTLAEGAGTEDGGHYIAVFDAETLELRTRCPLAHAGMPSGKTSPDMSFGGYPNPNGLAIADDLVFTANGGSSDVSVLRLDAVTAGRPDAEIGRIAVPSGPFGIAFDPERAIIATADREDARSGRLGNSVSLIDLAAARADVDAVKPVTIRIGADDGESRPFVPVFSTDGVTLYVTCQATNTLSAVDIASALARPPDAERRIALSHPRGGAASPRGLAISGDGTLLAVAGGPKGNPESGVVWFVAVSDLAVQAVVQGAGNEPYLVALASFS
jgi:DNA-binding beta-propeller fold protein YncE